MLRWYLIIKAFWGFNCASNFAFLRPFLFCKGICKVPRCNGLKILAPKHLWKSKIGALQLIWATKRYVTFFLGHPVHMTRAKLLSIKSCWSWRSRLLLNGAAGWLRKVESQWQGGLGYPTNPVTTLECYPVHIRVHSPPYSHCLYFSWAWKERSRAYESMVY